MRTAIMALLVVLPLSANAQGQTANAQEILDCAAANNPAKTFAHHVRFTTINAEGSERVLQTRIMGERGEEGLQINLRVTAPVDLADTTLLLRERGGQDDMRIHIPAAQRTQRVTGNMAATSLLGTDFNYQDLKQMFGSMLDGEASYLESAELAGRTVDRIRLTPDTAEAAPYDEVVVAFDRSTCVPMQGLFRMADGQVLRRLDADPASLASVGEHDYARVYTLQDLASQTRTEVEFSDVEYDERLPRSAFHPISFRKVE